MKISKLFSAIRSLFIPEIVGDYYLVTQRMVSIEITPTTVRAAVVKAKGRTRTVEKTVEKELPKDQAGYQENVVNALISIKNEIKRYDQLYALIPSNVCVIKVLSLPAGTADQAALLVPFEIEPTLPFALSEATIDSFILKSDAQTVTVLAVAIKNSVLAEYLAPYYQAAMIPTRVAVDILELYALYASAQAPTTGTELLLYLDKDATRIAILHNTSFQSARVLPAFLAEESEENNSRTDKTLRDIVFTVQAARSKRGSLSQHDEAERCTLMGLATQQGSLEKLIEQTIGVTCTTLTLSELLEKKLIKNTTIKNATKHTLDSKYSLVVSAALALPFSKNFNLYTEQAEHKDQQKFTRQLLTIALLLLATVGTVIGIGWWRIRKLNYEITNSEAEAISRLKKEFPNAVIRSSKSLELVKNAASAELTKEKNIWFALSPQSRASILRYLQELSTQLAAQDMDLTLSQVAFDEDSILLEGEVKDYEGLKRFEQALRRSKLFSTVPRLEGRVFSTKIPLDTAGDRS